MYKKPGLPNKDDLVICTVRQIESHSCQVCLDEFKNCSGTIHTSEMRRRQVRNKKIFFKTGRVLVCKVINTNENERQVNLSLRKTGEGQRRSKLKEWKNEEKADNVLKYFAKKNNMKIEDVYKKLTTKVLRKYKGLYPFFLEVARLKSNLLKELKIENKLSNNLFKLIKERIKIPKTEEDMNLRMYSEKANGLELIKKSINKVFAFTKKKNAEVSINYISAPKYRLKIKTERQAEVENILENILKILKSEMGDNENVRFEK